MKFTIIKTDIKKYIDYKFLINYNENRCEILIKVN